MMRVLLFGASTNPGKYVIEQPLNSGDTKLVLLSRRIDRLEKFKSERVSLLQADATWR